MILPFIAHLSTYFYVDIFNLKVDKNGLFWTTYPPHLIQVVFERPLAAAPSSNHFPFPIFVVGIEIEVLS